MLTHRACFLLPNIWLLFLLVEKSIIEKSVSFATINDERYVNECSQFGETVFVIACCKAVFYIGHSSEYKACLRYIVNV